MSDAVDSTTKPCPHCHNSGPVTSRIPDETPTRCPRSRSNPCVGCQKLSETNKKIEEARHTLNNLLKEREALSSVINKHHDPISHRFPVEVTSQIFLNCRAAIPAVNRSFERREERELIRSVFALGHICQSWRKIARGTPQLWSIISARITRSNCFSTLSFVQEWLELSRGVLLFLQLAVDQHCDTLACSVARKVITAIIQHSHRWKVLDVKIPRQFLTWISNLLANHHLERLEHVKFSSYLLDGINIGPKKGVLTLQASPRYVTQRSWFSQLSINLNQLTHFYAPYFLTPDEFTQLLECAPCLLLCHVVAVKGNISSDLLVSSLSLKTLIIGAVSGDLWDHLTLPSLEVLHVIQPKDFTSWINFQVLLRRSECRLKELVIEDEDSQRGAASAVVDILNFTSDLQRLEVRGDLLNQTFFFMMDEAASPLSATTGFLDNLESFSCTTDNGAFKWAWPVAFLHSMISKPQRKLQSFKFRYEGKLSEEHCDDTLRDKKMFMSVVDALKTVEFDVLDGSGMDLIESLRCHHGL